MAAINVYLAFILLFFFLFCMTTVMQLGAKKKKKERKKKRKLVSKRLVLVVNALLLLIASLASNFQCSGFPFSLLMMPYSCGSNMVRISCNTLKRLNAKMCPG